MENNNTKIPLITSKNVNINISKDNVDDLTKSAINISEKLQIEKNLIYSSTIEIIKMIINILDDCFEKEEITYSKFKQATNLLMMNGQEGFTRKLSNISDNTKKQITMYYNMQEETQTAVISAIQFGFRKVKESEKIFE